VTYKLVFKSWNHVDDTRQELAQTYQGDGTPYHRQSETRKELQNIVFWLEMMRRASNATAYRACPTEQVTRWVEHQRQAAIEFFGEIDLLDVDGQLDYLAKLLVARRATVSKQRQRAYALLRKVTNEQA
jgi:pyruvate carboxylase